MDVDRDDSVRTGIEAIARAGRPDRRRGGRRRLGARRRGRADLDRGRPGAARDQLLGVRSGSSPGPCRSCVRQVPERVVLISSIGGIVALPFQAFYSASKFAMEGYGEALAYEVAPFGIQVTLVEPGNVRTDFTANRRDAVAPEGDDPYRQAATARAVAKMAEDEAKGVPPEVVAAVVQRVLGAAPPPRRSSVGKMDERVGIARQAIDALPPFEQAAKGSLGV